MSPWVTFDLPFDLLFGLSRSATIKAHGIDVLLKPFVDDLKVLHDTGITIQVSGKDEVWKGALLAFLADNLAAHELGGSFSFAYRFYGKKRGLSGSFPFTLREPVSHAYHCSVLDGPDSNKSSVEYGVNRLSLLDSLPYFSGMPHDIMHDLFELRIETTN